MHSVEPAGEGVDGLRTLYDTARVLQSEDRPAAALIADVLRLLPSGWQYPDITCARVFFGDIDICSPGFANTPWMQAAPFTTRDGGAGGVEICYLEERPSASEGPFLDVERHLINGLADLFRSFFEHVTAAQALRQARDDLEGKVRLRTAQLEDANRSLEQQLDELRGAKQKIEQYQGQLRKVASELSLAEARSRRVIAQDLHDQIGQALAFIRMRVLRFQGDAVFCGFEASIEEILRLLTQTINSTRSLTFEISPSILYELGLGSALEWLAERMTATHHVDIEVSADHAVDGVPDDTRVVLFQAVRELLVNAIKHADPRRVTVTAGLADGAVRVVVTDDGGGFDVDRTRESGVDGMAFGLFSIRERLTYLGGSMLVESAPGEGTSVTLETPVGSDVEGVAG